LSRAIMQAEGSLKVAPTDVVLDITYLSPFLTLMALIIVCDSDQWVRRIRLKSEEPC
jgi:hypothetical protein